MNKKCIECGREDLPHFSKKRCIYCSKKSYTKPKGSTKKAIDNRRMERECLKEFFPKHMKLIKQGNKRCKECGGTLYGHVSEVAHIAPKSLYKEIMCEDENVIYLCGMYSDNNCHANFDNWGIDRIQNMNIFPYCRDKILGFIEKGIIFTPKFLNRFKIE